MRPYILSECNWKDLKIQHFELAVLPWGRLRHTITIYLMGRMSMKPTP